MKQSKSVLIVDDEPEYLDTLRDCFAQDHVFEYEVKTHGEPSECILVADRSFDLCVVDLGIGRPTSFLGFNLLIGLSCVRNGGVGIVYSAFPETKNVVLAMQLGAAAFYSKAEYAPDEFVRSVDQWICCQERKVQEDRLIEQFILSQSAELDSRYGGKTVGIEFEDGKPMVVASGNSRLEMLLEYQDLYDRTRAGNSPRNVQAFPYIHQVSESNDGDI